MRWNKIIFSKSNFLLDRRLRFRHASRKKSEANLPECSSLWKVEREKLLIMIQSVKFSEFDRLFKGQMKCINSIVGMFVSWTGQRFKFTINIEDSLTKKQETINTISWYSSTFPWNDTKVNCTLDYHLWKVMIIFSAYKHNSDDQINTKHVTVLDLFSSLHIVSIFVSDYKYKSIPYMVQRTHPIST